MAGKRAFEVGQLLRQLRIEKGLSEAWRTKHRGKKLTQEALADQVGLSARTIRKLEAGDAAPGADACVKLARFYGVERTALLVTDSARPPPVADTITAYLDALTTQHRELPGLFAHTLELQKVFVELRLETEGQVETHGEAFTLLELMQLRAPVVGAGRRHGSTAQTAPGAPRWVVLGAPGAGKSTLARHLTHSLAQQRHGPVPVYIPLPLLCAADCHPFDFAQEKQLGVWGPRSEAEGLQRELTELAKHPDRVWLLLDGLDEITRPQLSRLKERLRTWLPALRHVTIVVFSRHIGYEPLGGEFCGQASIVPLDASQQRLLLGKWIGDPERAERVLEALSPALRQACQVPLTLSLLGNSLYQGAYDETQRYTKRSLLQLSIDTLLRKGASDVTEGALENWEDARTILEELSLDLMSAGSDAAWSLDVLKKALKKNATCRDLLLENQWSRATFLSRVAERSGVLADHDNNEHWRFFHRQFQELLGAAALHRQRGVLEKASTLSGQEVPRWAELLAFACEMHPDPSCILRALADQSEALLYRVLPEVEKINPIEALELLRAEGHWDGCLLVNALCRWKEHPDFDRESVIDWLWNWVSPTTPTDRLAHVLYALEYLSTEEDPLSIEGARVFCREHRQRFFERCERWPANGLPPEQQAEGVPTWLRMPPDESKREDTFLMGSPHGEGNDEEHPQHPVTLDAFLLGQTAVTNEQYQVFEPDHRFKRGQGRHPVVRISWWSAYLYCRWLGGALPTEAQWEYACRAGQSEPTLYHSGDSESDLSAVGWYDENSKRRLHAVAELRPNAFGLYDMHGNVWEWCRDWYSPNAYRDPTYQARPGDGLRNVRDGSVRVVRGGSWSVTADRARSAFRFVGSRGLRYSGLGFRASRPLHRDDEPS